jgi:tetratricopeptide (TPR) repeat protein
VQRALEQGNREEAFHLLPPLADLYLEAAMYDVAHQIYQALADYYELGADDRQFTLFTKRRDTVQAWRLLASLRAGHLPPEDRLSLQKLLDSSLFSLHQTSDGVSIVDDWERRGLLSPLLLAKLRTISAYIDRQAAALDAQAQAEGRHLALLDNLPRRPDIFVGRHAEIARCLEALSPEARGWGVIIDGIGGIGKTALALQVAHIARDSNWFDAYLFASAKTTYLTTEGVRQETLAPSSLDAFVREFARHLGRGDIIQITDAAERQRALKEALQSQRILLIWDNLETLVKEERSAITKFLNSLPTPGKAIVTSRYRVEEGAAAISTRLNRLSEEEAFELMDEVGLQKRRVAEELRQSGKETRLALYEAAGGNPLALHWTLGLVAAKGYTLQEALAHLKDAAQIQDLFAFLFADAVRDLPDNDKKVLIAISSFQTPAATGALADITDLPPTAIGMALERLKALSLVNELEDERYGLHPLTRAYVRAALGEGSEVVRVALGGLTLDPAAYRKALGYWLDYAQTYGGDKYQTFDRLEAEWPSLEAAATALRDLAGVPGPLEDQEAARMLNDLAKALRTFLDFRGYWDEQVRLNEWAYEAAKALGDWQAAGWRALDVTWIHYNRAETDRAATWSDCTSEAMERGGGRYDRAAATRLRGLVAQQRGDLAEAERLFTEALAVYRDLGMKANRALVLNDLGSLARARKEYNQAENYYHQALALVEEAGYKTSQAISSSGLALLALARGLPAEARPWYERELALAKELGWLSLVANAQEGLAKVLEKEGRPAEALPLAEEALRIRERLREWTLDWTRQLVTRLREKAAR